MSSIVTEQGILHYESIGRGKPVILLHGWINSWNVWRDSMIALARNGNYRVYALDFWGFGASAKSAPVSAFKMDSYVQMVHQFMNALGIQSAPIFGHSMGGTVALKMALEFPDRVSKVAVVGSPVVGRTLNPFLKFAGYSWIADTVDRYPTMLKPLTTAVTMSVMRVLLARDSTKVRDMITRDVQQTTIDSFVRSIGDLRQTDLRRQLHTLKIPTLGIYGTKDNIVVPRNNVKLLSELVQTSVVTEMNYSRHFPMTDEPQKFLDTLHLFLSSPNGSSPNGSGRPAIAYKVNGSHG